MSQTNHNIQPPNNIVPHLYATIQHYWYTQTPPPNIVINRCGAGEEGMHGVETQEV